MNEREPIPALQPADTLPTRIDLGEGEDIVLSLKPHWIYILIDRVGVLVVLLFVALALALFAPGAVRLLGVAAIVAWLLWQCVERASRVYVLTDRRVVMVAGVLRQIVVDAPLANVRQVTVYRTIPERLLGLGTVAFATAGTGGQDIIWRVLDRPTECLRIARDAMDSAGARP